MTSFPFVVAPSLQRLRHPSTVLDESSSPTISQSEVLLATIFLVGKEGTVFLTVTPEMLTVLILKPESTRFIAITASMSSTDLASIPVTSTNRLPVPASTLVMFPLIIGGKDSNVPLESRIAGKSPGQPAVSSAYALPGSVCSNTSDIVKV